MSINSDFLNTFNTQIQKLQNLNQSTARHLRERQTWSTSVKNKLVSINQMILQVGQKISVLNQQITSYGQQKEQNNSAIQERDRQIAQLTQQLQQIQREKEEIENQRISSMENSSRKEAELNKRISELEEQLRVLQNQLAESQSQIEQLRQVITTNGSEAEKRKAEALKQQLEQHNKALQQKHQEVEQELQAKDTQIQQLQQKSAQEVEQLKQQLHDTRQGHQDISTQIQALTQERDTLQQTNAELTRRIMAATEIVQVTLLTIGDLELDPDVDQKDINKKIGDIETSLQQISNSIQGSSPYVSTNGGVLDLGSETANAAVSLNNSPLEKFRALSEDQQQQIISQFPAGKRYEYTNILDQGLSADANSPTGKTAIQNAINLLNRYANISGGKSRRRRRYGRTIKRRRVVKRCHRTKKMKGGFKYSPHAKRHGLTSFSRSSRPISSVKSKRHSSRRSSIPSSY